MRRRMSEEESSNTDETDEGVEIPVETSADETTSTAGVDADPPEDESVVRGDDEGARERLEEEADRARSEFDSRVVDILSWVLDTETRARIYVHLRKSPWSTSEEVAEGTGLYPSTVREALASLAEEDVVERRKRQSEGAGNNPYEYTAIAPSDLVGTVVGRVQDELNTLFNLDSHLEETEPTSRPVSIEVTAGEDDATEAAVDEGATGDGSESDTGSTAGAADAEDGPTDDA
ncbi:MAG: helix-turn-helix domain-containing protein [Halanaeroarchaeum sp.]